MLCPSLILFSHLPGRSFLRYDKKKKGGKKHARRSKMGGRHRTPSDYKSAKLGKGNHKGSDDKQHKSRVVSTKIRGQKVKGKASLVELAQKRGLRFKGVVHPKKLKALKKKK